MLIDSIAGLLKGIGADKLVDRAADKVLGESPEVSVARDKANQEHEVAEEQADTERLKALWDFISKYEGTAEQVPKTILWLRAAPRPILVILGFIATYYAHFTGNPIPPTSTAGIITLALLLSFLGTKLNRDMKL